MNRPDGFISLKPHFPCENYYAGRGGRDIGFTPEICDELGLTNPDDVIVHHSLATNLARVKQTMELKYPQYELVVSDGFRSVETYQRIIEHRRARNLSVQGLINEVDMPHATGMAIDVTLRDTAGGESVWIRNSKRDGSPANKFGFYIDHRDNEGMEYHRLQLMLYRVFTAQGFELGKFRECWHFQLKGITAETPRY